MTDIFLLYKYLKILRKGLKLICNLIIQLLNNELAYIECTQVNPTASASQI